MPRTRDLLLILLLTWVPLGSTPAMQACSQDPDDACCGLPAVVHGPSRIAPPGTDLDPVRTSGEDDVCVMLSPTRLRMAWLQAPEIDSTGQTPIPAALHRHGRIRILGGEVEAGVTIAAGAPGGGEPRLERLELTVDLPHAPLPGASPEVFGFQDGSDELVLAKAFLEHFQDGDEFLIIWLDFPHPLLGGGANAYRFTFKSTVRGTGRAVLEPSDLAGRDRNLRGIVHVGMLAVSSLDPEDNPSRDLPGARVLSHWSLDLDSDAAVRSGNDPRAKGDGPLLILGGPPRLSELDLYLMGLIPPEQVRDFFYVDNLGDPDPEPQPRDAVTLIGDRGAVRIEQIIATPRP